MAVQQGITSRKCVYMCNSAALSDDFDLFTSQTAYFSSGPKKMHREKAAELYIYIYTSLEFDQIVAFF